MKPVDVKPSTYIDFSKEINYQLPKFKIGDFARISKYNFFFCKTTMFQIGLKKFLCLKQFKNTVSWVYVISNFKGVEIFGTFYGKELQKANQKEIGVENCNKEKR